MTEVTPTDYINIGRYTELTAYGNCAYIPGIDAFRSSQLEAISPVQWAVHLPLPTNVLLDKMNHRLLGSITFNALRDGYKVLWSFSYLQIYWFVGSNCWLSSFLWSRKCMTCAVGGVCLWPPATRRYCVYCNVWPVHGWCVPLTTRRDCVQCNVWPVGGVCLWPPVETVYIVMYWGVLLGL